MAPRPASLVTATLQEQTGKTLTLSIQLVRGDGVHLTRTWRSHAQAAALLPGSLPSEVSIKRPPDQTWRVGDRVALLVVLTRVGKAMLGRVAGKRPAQKAIRFHWSSPTPSGLIRLSRDRPAKLPELASRMIDQLGSPSFSRRERASRSLMRYGKAAAPLLREALKGHVDLELRSRARRLLRRLRAQDGLAIERRVRHRMGVENQARWRW